MLTNEIKIAVIGLGYVGLPLAVEFGKKYPTLGFDINTYRIAELKEGRDFTKEVKSENLNQPDLKFSSDEEDLKQSNVYIVTVPTPINKDKTPDLTALEQASLLISRVLNSGDIVVYESTVYPGVTEDFCIPIIQDNSGFVVNKDFFVGYSPERINPGDGEHKLNDITKIISASNKKTLEKLFEIYDSIIDAEVYKSPSIRVAEAAKVIENTQRDVNIALINELSIIFNNLGLNTKEVLDAASTKWNFVNFKPGLVGGHCIGVDPYYLLFKSQESGYNPKIITAGREINDFMPTYISQQVIKLMKSKSINLKNSNVLILGVTFKEDCPDIRNTKVIDIVENLEKENCLVDIYDPIADSNLLEKTYSRKLIKEPKKNTYDAILITVGHEEFKLMGLERIQSYGREKSVIYDVKSLFNSLTDGAL